MSTHPSGPLTRDEAIALLKSNGSPLAISRESIRGVEFDVFTHAPNDLRDIFTFSNRHFADREFLIYEDECLTFGEVHARVIALCTSLKDCGVQSGDRVAIAMRNYPEYCIALEAILSIGAVAVLLNSWWQEDEIEYSLRDSGARFAFVDQERWLRLVPSRHLLELGVAITRAAGDVPVGALSMADLMAPKSGEAFPSQRIETDSDALILYTSGSTGLPRGVVLTHRSTISGLLNFSFVNMMATLTQDNDVGVRNEVFDWSKGGGAAMDDPLAARLPMASMLVSVPFFHISGLVTMLLLSYRSARKLILMYRWNAAQALELIERDSLTMLEGVPTMIGDVLNSPDLSKRDVSSLVRVSGGGSARPPKHVKLLQELIPQAVPSTGYGMTETNAAGATIAGGDYVARPDSVGHPTPPLVSLEIRDEDDTVLGPNEDGEICMKSALNMRCYWNKPEATAKTLRDGWIYSGDIGHLDDEGFLYITGRVKDIIIRGGENITCGEIEYVLYEHPSVNEVAVYGAPDDRLGEIVCATIYLKKECSSTEEEMQEHIGSRLAAFKVPTHVLLVDEPLPRIAAGKFDKQLLQKRTIEWLQELKSRVD